MQKYSVQTLLYELRNQGVILKPTKNGKLFVDGELSFEQYNAVKTLKPDILNFISESFPISAFSSRKFRFGESEYLFYDLDTCLSIFDISNDSALRFIQYLINFGDKCRSEGVTGVLFNQPTTEAYISELNLVDGILKREKQQLSDNQLKILADIYIKTHMERMSFADWLSDDAAPLYSIKLKLNNEIVEVMIGNSIQVAITSAFWLAIHPEASFEISFIKL